MGRMIHLITSAGIRTHGHESSIITTVYLLFGLLIRPSDFSFMILLKFYLINNYGILIAFALQHFRGKKYFNALEIIDFFKKTRKMLSNQLVQN